MPRLNFPLKKYEKAVCKIAIQKGLGDVRVTATKGSIVRFELFEGTETVPRSIWVIHHSHNKKKEIWSKEDYKKASRHLCCSYDEFIKVIESI